MASIAQPATHVSTESSYQSGVWSWITTIDHKRIGILYGVSALIFFLMGGLEAMIIRVQLSSPNNDVVSAATYNELFTMHGTTMIFLAIMPLSNAFFNYIVPLQIGARDVAFPRLNAFAVWTFIFGGLLINASWFFNEAPNQGWYGYAPLTEISWNPGRNVDFRPAEEPTGQGRIAVPPLIRHHPRRRHSRHPVAEPVEHGAVADVVE